MQNFFVYDSQVQGENIYIEGTDVNHIVHVLRMKVGEEVSVHDDVNRKYLCRIEKLLEERVVLSIVEATGIGHGTFLPDLSVPGSSKGR